MAIEPPADLNRDFLLWLLRAKRHDLEVQASGSTFSAVTGKVVRGLPIKVPPREEQDRIVERIEGVDGRIRIGEEQFAAALNDVDEYRTAVLGKLRERQHPTAALGSIADVCLGATPSRTNDSLWDGDIPWVSSGEVAFCRISATRETISRAGLGDPAKRLHFPGTVLLAMYGEGKTRGQAAVLEIQAATNQAVAAIRLQADKMEPTAGSVGRFSVLVGVGRGRRVRASRER